jgi:tetratricopeptide (TPR) repeat protein
LWVQGQFDESANLLEQALRTFREIGDRSAVSSVKSAHAKILMLKNDLPAARKDLSDALQIDQEMGAKGEVALDRVELAQIDLTERHPEQVDEHTLQSSIDELHAEQRGGAEVEALTIQIQAFLASGKLDSAKEALLRAQGMRHTTWLASHYLILAAARIDAAQGNIGASRRRIEDARSQAGKVGCRACDLESKLFLSGVVARDNGRARTQVGDVTAETRYQYQPDLK